MKFIKIALLFAALAALSGFASAKEGVLNTQFQGWLGKNQHGYYLDPSSWAECSSTQGGSCPTVSRSTGHSQCRTQGFDIGGNWAPPQLGGMGIAGGYSKSWSACNTRSETVSCTPAVHYKGRAVIHFSQRWGREKVLGGDNYLTLRSSCPGGWRSDWMGGSSWRCTYVGGSYTRDGYLPEYRNAACEYQHL